MNKAERRKLQRSEMDAIQAAQAACHNSEHPHRESKYCAVLRKCAFCDRDTNQCVVIPCPVCTSLCCNSHFAEHGQC